MPSFPGLGASSYRLAPPPYGYCGDVFGGIQGGIVCTSIAMQTLLTACPTQLRTSSALSRHCAALASACAAAAVAAASRQVAAASVAAADQAADNAMARRCTARGSLLPFVFPHFLIRSSNNHFSDQEQQ
jgi:hypothetical protein